MSNYEHFLRKKAQEGADNGFDPIWMPDQLFDFQAALVEWAIRKGRAALFEDTGLGKTLQELVWAENVHRHTNKPVLILTPLAVAAVVDGWASWPWIGTGGAIGAVSAMWLHRTIRRKSGRPD